jgi:hypothetical protein
MDDWKDTHSVTCLLCEDLADERETVNITTDVGEIGPTMAIENPQRFEAIMAVADALGQGEAHQECFDHYLDGYEAAEYEDIK